MKKLFIVLFPLVFSSCAVKVAYQLASVPEEGGIRFTQLTQEDEDIAFPQIIKDEVTKSLQWYAAPLIAISPSGEYSGQSVQ